MIIMPKKKFITLIWEEMAVMFIKIEYGFGILKYNKKQVVH